MQISEEVAAQNTARDIAASKSRLKKATAAFDGNEGFLEGKERPSVELLKPVTAADFQNL